MPVESGKLKLNLKGGTPWVEKKKKKKKLKAPEADPPEATEEPTADTVGAGPTTTSKCQVSSSTQAQTNRVVQTVCLSF